MNRSSVKAVLINAYEVDDSVNETGRSSPVIILLIFLSVDVDFVTVLINGALLKVLQENWAHFTFGIEGDNQDPVREKPLQKDHVVEKAI